MNKSVKGSRLYAVLKGAVDAGLSIPHSEEALPAIERINGKSIADYANKTKENEALYKKQFGGYLKSNIDPSNLNKYFEDAKKKILEVK